MEGEMYTVKISGWDDSEGSGKYGRKILAILGLREVFGFGLNQAKATLENLPFSISVEKYEDAEKILRRLAKRDVVGTIEKSGKKTYQEILEQVKATGKYQSEHFLVYKIEDFYYLVIPEHNTHTSIYYGPSVETTVHLLLASEEMWPSRIIIDRSYEIY